MELKAILLGVLALWLTLGSFSIEFSSAHNIANDFQAQAPHLGCSPFAKSSPVHCEEDLHGSGSFDTTCYLEESVSVGRDLCIAGAGNLSISSDVTLDCPFSGCTIAVSLSGDVILGVNASIVAGTIVIQAENTYLRANSSLSSLGLGGAPPAQTSGTPSGLEGAGGGHGGRGACCATKDQGDIWGGDVYAWSSLATPWCHGSRGGSTSETVDYSGGGGGRINVTVIHALELNGTISADGGSGGKKGGGGSGGSVIVGAARLTGVGTITARGGDGRGGGGGGRVAVKCYRQEDVSIYVHGGSSFGCPENAGAAGTLFYVVRQSLTISNNNKSTVTDTPLLDFPTHPLWVDVEVLCRARVVVPLLWSRVLVRGQISLSYEGTLIFGLAHYPSSEFELVAEEVVMENSIIKVYGALKLSVKMLLMWNSILQIDGGGDVMVSTSTMEASNLVFIRGKSALQSNTNLGIHGQGMLKLAGAGDYIRAQRLFLSLFYNIHIGPGAMLLAPPDETTTTDESSKLYCDTSKCPAEIINPPEDCTLNVSLPFTLQICRVEDIAIDGVIRGSVVHLQRGRTVTVNPGGLISAAGLGCKGGLGKGHSSSSGAGGGGGFGGRGGKGYYKGSWSEGGDTYGKKTLPCELGSGGGNSSTSNKSSSGGGVIVMGSQNHPLSTLEVYGTISADGGSLTNSSGSDAKEETGAGGGSGGSVLLFLQNLALQNGSVLSAGGGEGGYVGGGGGGGGRVHFHWSNVPTGDDFVAIATIKGLIHTKGGNGGDIGYAGDDGTITGKECPSGLFGVFCMECPVGTYKNDSGSDASLCKPCPPEKLPRRASYVYVRGGALKPTCPYQCHSDKYRMPNCYTPLEELIYALGGPWLFTLLLSGLMIALALVLSIARAKLVGTDDFSGPTPAPQGAHIDHSFPFLESLNEVLETTRVEESQSHVHRMFFMGCNSFAEPWHLPHSPPEQIVDLVYEDAFNRFVDEINCLAAYQWWEGSVYSILCFAAYPVGWSWQQWRRRRKVQQLREFVRSEYDHACLRSCRSRALYEGLKVAATAELVLGYIDVFLGGDEKRPDLPPKLMQRLPMSIIFGGDGSYMAPYHLHSDNLLTSLMGQAIPATIWYRMVAGLNAQLRLVRKGRLRSTLIPVIEWLNSHANPRLEHHGVAVRLAWFQATASGYYQLGLVLNTAESFSSMPLDSMASLWSQHPSEWLFFECRTNNGVQAPLLSSERQHEQTPRLRRAGGGLIDTVTLRTLEDSRDILYPLSLLLQNTRCVGHHALVGLVISILLLADFSLTLLLLLQFYSISLDAFLVVLLVLPLASLLPFPTGINALFSHGPRKAAGLARVYNLWNMTSLTNTVAAFVSGFFHYKVKFSSKNLSSLLSLAFSSEENNWWLIPVALLVCKCTQARIVDWHAANLEIQDRTVYTEDPAKFWEA
ncbi:hypothetical protein SELMODRAFT_98651 [Selaginella moellendorffii]|uniref:DUF8003 domain-containing protein n=1 Tax=Selaginella moellendorffii TaxID=88036 RepID=D8RPL3_SELML|nr:hypothetical protein SELMODRAFT_98651 [Selaginella moellendorffii]